MHCFFVGSPERQLFACYHAAAPQNAKAAAVLLCYPGPHESMAVHWAFRRLALRLAKEGFAVLRFDYYGTGDSAGASDAGTLSIWRDNIQEAAHELLAQSGVTKLHVVGMRLGAALAVEASRALKVRDLVLWEPVVQGSVYLRQLKEVDASLGVFLLYPPPLMPKGYAHELCGAPFTEALYSETEAIDLTRAELPSAIRTHLFSQDDAPHYQALAQRYETELKRFNRKLVPAEAGPSANLLGAAMLNAIVDALARKDA